VEIRLVNVWKAYNEYAYQESDLDLGLRILYNKSINRRRIYVGILGFGISLTWNPKKKLHNGNP
jgi:hypothetical protein